MSELTATAELAIPAVSQPIASHVSPSQAVRQSLTLAWRSLVQVKHNPMELFDLSLQPLMFVVLFAYVFGGAISGGPAKYLQFGLAGLIAQNSLFVTLNTAVGLNTDIGKGIFDRFRSLPIARSGPLAGRILADVLRQAWSVLVLLATGLALGFRVHTGPLQVLGALAVVIVVAFAFSWIAVLVGLVVDTVEKVQVFGFVVLFPLTFASSAFVPTRTMPGWLQAWVKVNPTSVMADSLRGLLVGGPVAAPLTQALLWVVGVLLVFVPLALRAFRRRT